MANATIRVQFGNPDGSAAGGHLSAEIDTRPQGLNGVRTSFSPGETAYILVYKSDNVGITDTICSAGSLSAQGSAVVTVTEELMFEDDTLTFNKKRCLEFAEEILRRGIKIKWSANSRCDVDLETMVMLKKAGARLFCVGVESGDQVVLDQMKKAMKVERVRQFFKDAKKAGIKLHGCFMVGNPGETKETLETTLNFAKELNPDTAQFFPIMVYPGTEAYQWAKSNGFLTTSDFREWLTPDGMHNSIVSRPGLSNTELVEFCDRARKEFYIRPSYIFRKMIDGLTDLQEFKRLAKGGWTLGRHIFRGTYGGGKK